MSMGEDVAKFLTQPSYSIEKRNEINGFLEHVQLFFIEAALQIKKRFPIDDPILKSLTFLNPDTIDSTNSKEVISLASKFPNIVIESELEKLDHEWRELQFLDPDDLPNFSERRKDIVSFWGSLSQMIDTSGESRFPTVSKLTKSLLSLPHSNADVERVFSQVVLIKTKTRNSLKSHTLDAVLMTKQSLSSCIQFKPDKSMYKRMNSSIYDSASSDSD